MKIFLDSSDINQIRIWKDRVDGFTTNPTLMHKAGVLDYKSFCVDILKETNKPISFEVFADDFEEMKRQAEIISSWGENIYVKIPIMNTKGKSSVLLINDLLAEKIKLNITAVFKPSQLVGLGASDTKHIISVFAGRIADTGLDPRDTVSNIRMGLWGTAEILWASPREVLNIYQAQAEGADIITCTPDLLEKYEKNKQKDLLEFSRETVQMFYDDAKKSGFTL